LEEEKRIGWDRDKLIFKVGTTYYLLKRLIWGLISPIHLNLDLPSSPLLNNSSSQLPKLRMDQKREEWGL